MLYSVLCYFFVYAFLGWCGEVCFAAVRTRKFVNRGFLNGPVCPIYGFGVVLVALTLRPVGDNLPLLFICSVLLTSALEWLTGFLLERIFHQRWWNYLERPFNLNGYICLEFSLVWGVACVLVLRVLHPLVARLVALMPRGVGLVLLVICVLLFIADLSATVAAMVGLNRRLRQLEELAQRMRAASDELGEGLSQRMISSSDKLADLRDDLAIRTADFKEELAERTAGFKEDLSERAASVRSDLAELRQARERLLAARRFGQRRLLRAFPRMTSTRYAAALEELRRRAAFRRKEKK